MEPHSGLNDLDYIVMGIVLLSGLLALMRGFVREMFSLVAWIGAYFAAVKFYPLVTPWVHHYIKHDKTAEWCSIAAVYIVTLILLIVAGSIIAHYAVRGRALTAVDRSLGFLYGLFRGAVVVCLVYLGAVMVLWPDIDNPLPATAVSASVVSATVVNPVIATPTQLNKEQQDKDRTVPPDMLMQARTRPLLAAGGKKLAVFIPKDMIDKTLQNLTTQKGGTQKELDQRALDLLSTPAPQTQPASDDQKQHLELNRLMDPGSKP